MTAYTFYLYDRWGEQIGTIENVTEAIHLDEVNGEDSLKISVVGQSFVKGQRVVWRDKFGKWHEHTVSEVTTDHADGNITTTAYCENSIAELLTDYIEEKEPSGGAAAALARALDGTRWEPGQVTVPGEAQTSWYHISAYEAVADIIEVWGGELQTTIELSGGIVTGRMVDILSHRGGSYGKLFDYGYDLVSVTRTVDSDDVCTALYGYGKGLEKYDEDGNSTGGYSRKLTFGGINGGNDWIGDEEARMQWGLPDGKGGTKHTFGQVEFSDCEDQSQLLALTKEELKKRSKPRITYSAKVASLAEGGFTNGEDAAPGDDVDCHDGPLDERISGRVMAFSRDLLNEQNDEITLGNMYRTSSESVKESKADLDWLKSHVTNWDMTVNLSSSYVNAVINNWNEVINAAGGYVYWEQGEGITVLDRPIDQNPTMAIQLKGAGFRIANSKKSNGEWDWRTFGTGDGFTADLLNVGVIRGGSNYWNLETGDLLFMAGSIQDSKGNSWNMTSGTFNFTNGTINASTLNAGIIQDKAGNNSWNLDTGVLSMKRGRIEDSRGNYWDMSNGTLNFEFGKISADTITAGSLTVRNQAGQTIMEADIDGHTAEVGGFDAESEQLTGTALRVNLNRLEVISTFDTATLGWVGASWISGNEGHAYRFVALNSSSAAYCAGTALSCNDTAFLVCARIDIPYSTSVLTGNQIHVMRDLNFHQYSAVNFKAQGGVSGTFASPKSITVSGGIVTAVS